MSWNGMAEEIISQRWHDEHEFDEAECPYEVYSSIDIDEVLAFGAHEQALEYIADYRKCNIGEDGEFTDCLVIVHGAEFEIYPASEHYKNRIAA